MMGGWEGVRAGAGGGRGGEWVMGGWGRREDQVEKGGRVMSGQGWGSLGAGGEVGEEVR